jgi:hypothetical protein
MITRIMAAALLLAGFTGAAQAEKKGTFIGPGTYATAEGCQKLAKIEAGGDKNAGTVPETLDEDGFHSWEGSCSFHSFTETVKGKKWKANLKCFEEADESQESDIFERLDDGRIQVTVMGNSTVFEHCKTKEAK